jgi:hypothetical protein
MTRFGIELPAQSEQDSGKIMLNFIALENSFGLKGRSRLGVAGLSLFAGLFFAQSGFAQESPPSLIFQANFSNARINQLTFDPASGGGTATQFNTTTANQNSQIRALGFRAGGLDLVVADGNGTIDIFVNLREPAPGEPLVNICDAKDATPDDCPLAPEGIMTTAEFMAAVDSTPGDAPERIWSFPVCDFSVCESGFAEGQVVDDDVCIGDDSGGACLGEQARLLAETELVRGAFSFSGGTASSGDVLILVQDPAALLDS